MAGGTATYHELRQLGRRAHPTFAAMRGEAGNVFVIQRFVEPAPVLDKIAREAKSLLTNWHPNIARVRHVDHGSDELVVATELLEGVTFEDLLALASERGKPSASEPLLSHAIVARIFLDVLAGLQALHGLREGVAGSLNVFHGAICPANVVLGKDGVARLVAVFRPRPVTPDPKSEGFRFAAPELLARGGTQDARSDIHSVGAMLWEALMERPLYKGASIAELVIEQKEKDPPRPTARLADVVLRALELEPARRYRTAQEMAATMRALAGTIAPGSVVAQTVNDLASDRIKARRAELDPQASLRRRSTAPPPGEPNADPIPSSAVTKPALVPPRRPSRVPSPDPQDTTVRRRAAEDARAGDPLYAPAGAARSKIPDPPTQRVLPAAPPSEVTRPQLPKLPSSDPLVASAAPLRDEDPTPNEISDFPGPRPSMTEDDYLAELARTSVVEDSGGDAAALEAAREVVVSARSVAPAQRASAPAFPAALPPPPLAPAIPPSPIPNLATSSGVLPPLADSQPDQAAAAAAVGRLPRSLPPPLSRPPPAPRGRRFAPLFIAGIAVFAIVAMAVGATIIMRRGEDQVRPSDPHAPSPPSTVVVPPPSQN